MSDELAELRARVEALEAKLEGREVASHIQVERADIVEPDGQFRLTATNRLRSPDTTVDGVTMPGRGRPGMIFFNDRGDECGGLSFHATERGADAILSLDRMNQDQVISLRYGEFEGRYLAGLTVQERGPAGLAEFVREWEHIKGLPADEQPDAEQQLAERPGTGQTRVFLGRSHDGRSLLALADAHGRPRIQLAVTEQGQTSLSILNEDGEIEREL